MAGALVGAAVGIGVAAIALKINELLQKRFFKSSDQLEGSVERTDNNNSTTSEDKGIVPGDSEPQMKASDTSEQIVIVPDTLDNEEKVLKTSVNKEIISETSDSEKSDSESSKTESTDNDTSTGSTDSDTSTDDTGNIALSLELIAKMNKFERVIEIDKDLYNALLTSPENELAEYGYNLKTFYKKEQSQDEQPDSHSLLKQKYYIFYGESKIPKGFTINKLFDEIKTLDKLKAILKKHPDATYYRLESNLYTSNVMNEDFTQIINDHGLELFRPKGKCILFKSQKNNKDIKTDIEADLVRLGILRK